MSGTFPLLHDLDGVGGYKNNIVIFQETDRMPLQKGNGNLQLQLQ